MSPVSHPVIRHFLADDGRTYCGRPTEGKHITSTFDYVNCRECIYVRTHVPAPIINQEVEMSQSTNSLDRQVSLAQVANVFADRVTHISSVAAGEVNEYVNSNPPDWATYLTSLRRISAEMQNLLTVIRQTTLAIVGDPSSDEGEEFLRRCRYWLLKALRESVNGTIEEIENL